jgi:eukaryotic-like serine/threonine-protein kinase
MPPMTGRVIAGRYILDQPIGRGAMGVVWRGHDQLLDREVAVKEVVLSSAMGSDERQNAYQRTLREARTAARLSHRGVVTVFDVAEEDGRPWIVMELVPSRSLDQVLSVEGRMKPLRAGRIGQQLLAALASAHASGVLHRDVKPSNVLIARERAGADWNERAVLTDFGIAQFEGDPRLTQTGMVMGSPGFTAPERIRGGAATPASDLWSLGATIYAAVEGRGPYEQRGGAITTMSAIINEDAPVASTGGPLAPLIAALLRRDPSARPSAAVAARMFSDVLPILSSVAAESPHPATVRSAYVPPPPPPAAASAAPVPPPPPAAPAAEVPPAPVVSAPEASAPEASAPEVADVAEVAPPAPVASAVAVASVVPEEAEAAPDFADEAIDESMASSPSAPAEPIVAGGKEAPVSEGAADGVGDAAGADEGDAVVAAALAGIGAAAVDAAEAMPPDVPAPAAQSAATSLDLVPDHLVTPPGGGADAAEDAPLRVELPGPSFSPSWPAPPVSPQPVPPQPVSPQPVSPQPVPPQPVPSFSASRPAATDPPTKPQPPHEAPQYGDQAPARPSDGQRRSDGQRGSDAQWGSSAQWGSGTPYGSNAQYQGPEPQYAGPSQPYQDLAKQYPAGTGGRPQRSRRGRTIALIAAAVVVAAAAGGGAAYALRGHGGTSVPPSPATAFGSVNALNNPSTAVPSGWTPETVQASAEGTTAGFSIDVPPGWTERHSGKATDFTSPNGMVLDVDLTPHTYRNMLNEARFIKDQSLLKGTFPGYKQNHLQAVPVRGTQGAFWQFTWSPSDDVRQLSDDILFVLNTPAGSQSYALYFRAPDNGWNTTYLPVFEEILRTFQTTPS